MSKKRLLAMLMAGAMTVGSGYRLQQHPYRRGR